MTILHINKFYFLKGGAERHYFDLTTLLEAHGHTVIPFAMHHPDNVLTPWSKFFVSEKKYRSGTSVLERVRDTRDILWNFEAATKLEALIKEIKPDIAHLHNIAHQLSPSIIHTLHTYQIPIVQTLHDYKLISADYLLWPRKQPWTERIVLRAERMLHQLLRSYHLVDHFIAPSEYMKQVCVQAGIPTGKITVIPYCLPHLTSPWKGEEPASPLSLRRRGQGEVIPYFLFVGRLSPEKGVSTLLDAMKLLPDIHLKIVGTGPEIINNKLPNVEFLGHQDQAAVQRLMQGATALVVPSVWPENSPLVVYEAFTAGIPVLASRIGGIPELVQDMKNGLLFPLGNAVMLAATVKQFLALPYEHRHHMGEKGKLWMQGYADSEKIYPRLMKVYGTLNHGTISKITTV